MLFVSPRVSFFDAWMDGGSYLAASQNLVVLCMNDRGSYLAASQNLVVLCMNDRGSYLAASQNLVGFGLHRASQNSSSQNSNSVQLLTSVSSV